MDVTPLVKTGAQIIQSYADGGFRVSGARYDGAIIVDAAQTTPWSAAQEKDVKSLTEDDFTQLLSRAADIDVVLLGSGKTLIFLNPAIKNALKSQGLSIEVMDTGAACRTYNVLMAEGRRVTAALLPV